MSTTESHTVRGNTTGRTVMFCKHIWRCGYALATGVELVDAYRNKDGWVIFILANDAGEADRAIAAYDNPRTRISPVALRAGVQRARSFILLHKEGNTQPA